MAKTCEICYGTGKTELGFCSCTEGKLLKVMDQAKEKAAEQEVLEKEREKATPKPAKRKTQVKKDEWVPVDPVLQGINALETDWIKIRMLKTPLGTRYWVQAYVIDAKGDDLLIQTVGLSKEKGLKDIRGWIPNNNIEFLPQELEKVDINSMIDLALMANDEQWFKELVNK